MIDIFYNCPEIILCQWYKPYHISPYVLSWECPSSDWGGLTLATLRITNSVMITNFFSCAHTSLSRGPRHHCFVNENRGMDTWESVSFLKWTHISLEVVRRNDSWHLRLNFVWANNDKLLVMVMRILFVQTRVVLSSDSWILSLRLPRASYCLKYIMYILKSQVSLISQQV